jgi:hypothetical protein
MLIEKMLGNYGVEIAYLDGRKVAALCYGGDLDVSARPPLEELFKCITNQDEISDKIRIPSLMFKGHEGPILAATCIQKFWRMHKARVAYVYLKFLMEKAIKI